MAPRKGSLVDKDTLVAEVAGDNFASCIRILPEYLGRRLVQSFVINYVKDHNDEAVRAERIRSVQQAFQPGKLPPKSRAKEQVEGGGNSTAAVTSGRDAPSLENESRAQEARQIEARQEEARQQEQLAQAKLRQQKEAMQEKAKKEAEAKAKQDAKAKQEKAKQEKARQQAKAQKEKAKQEKAKQQAKAKQERAKKQAEAKQERARQKRARDEAEQEAATEVEARKEHEEEEGSEEEEEEEMEEGENGEAKGAEEVDIEEEEEEDEDEVVEDEEEEEDEVAEEEAEAEAVAEEEIDDVATTHLEETSNDSSKFAAAPGHPADSIVAANRRRSPGILDQGSSSPSKPPEQNARSIPQPFTPIQVNRPWRSTDEWGIEQLLEADRIVDQPLRLSSGVVSESSLTRSIEAVLALPEIRRLKPKLQTSIPRFIRSLFVPERYFNLRNCMCKIVAQCGSRALESRQRGSQSGSLGKLDGVPACFRGLVEHFQSAQLWSRANASTEVTTLQKAYHDMGMFLCWSRIKSVWLKTRHDYNRQEGNKGSDEEEDGIFLESDLAMELSEENALKEFFDQLLLSRYQRSELKYSVAATTRSVPLLKQLIAPFLGYTYRLEAQDRDPSMRHTARTFGAQWDMVHVTGKLNYTLARHLGFGALAVARVTDLRSLGYDALSVVCRTLSQEYQDLRAVFSTLHDVYVAPIINNDLLVKQRVEKFTSFVTEEELRTACSQNPQGLMGIFEPSNVDFGPEGSDGEDTISAVNQPAPRRSTVEHREALVSNAPFPSNRMEYGVAQRGLPTPPDSTRRARSPPEELAAGTARGAKRRG
ncbi:MAG: hypothetical protein Q9222_001952 [Ikaeria aurantiellina]